MTMLQKQNNVNLSSPPDTSTNESKVLLDDVTAATDKEKETEKQKETTKDTKGNSGKEKEEVKVTKMETYPYRIYNKIEDNYHLANKKALFVNMRCYYEAIGEDPFNSLPVTFHVKEGLEDKEFEKF